MKRWTFLLVAAAFVAGMLFTAAIAGEEGTVLIQNEYSKRLKNPVTLAHKKHAEELKISCTECHHAWKKEERKEPQKCAECHKEKQEGKAIGVKLAYHKQCMNCHKERQKEGKAAGPTTKCNDCHPSKAK